MYGIIYKAVNAVNGKVYVGQTVKNLAVRKSHHKFMAIKGDRRSPFQIALLDEGFDNFVWEEIDTAENQAELDAKEKHWIAHYDSTNLERGYNTFEGGSNPKHTTETKRKIGEANRNPSPETRIKKSEAKRGNKYNVGRKHTALARQHMSEAMKGKKKSTEHKQKLSELARGDKNPTAKLTASNVRQIRIALANGESGASLGRKYGVDRSIISDIKTGKIWAWVQAV